MTGCGVVSDMCLHQEVSNCSLLMLGKADRDCSRWCNLSVCSNLVLLWMRCRYTRNSSR
jgi:hypothetical protein